VRPVTSILGVLRRPQTPADLVPRLVAQLERQSRNPISTGLLGTPVISLLRRATVTPWGRRVFVITYRPRTRRQFARLPRRLRGVAVTHQIAVAFWPMSSGLYTRRVIAAGRAWGSESSRGPRHPDDRFVFLFPDGVARVALWNARSTAAHPRPLVSPRSQPVIVNVHANVAAFRATGFRSPGYEVWYGPTGRVVRRIANASSCGPPLGTCA
jgi:hypothetical protein